MKADKFQKMVRRILYEELIKKNAIGGDMVTRVPEMNANGVDPEERPKTFGDHPNTRDVKSKEALVSDLKKLTMEIDRDITVIWDDHDDLMVNARDLKFIRISPRWEDSFVIEMMTRNEDRIWATGQSWEQVKEFVKLNLKELNKQPTNTEKSFDRSYRNREDQTPAPDKGLPQKDKPTLKPLTTEPPRTSSKKDKDYTEKQVKDEKDLPEKPLREVTSFKRQIEHKSRSASAIRKEKTKFPQKNPNTQLTVKMGSQDTSKLK